MTAPLARIHRAPLSARLRSSPRSALAVIERFSGWLWAPGGRRATAISVGMLVVSQGHGYAFALACGWFAVSRYEISCRRAHLREEAEHLALVADAEATAVLRALVERNDWPDTSMFNREIWTNHRRRRAAGRLLAEMEAELAKLGPPKTQGES